jgi:hypothetical protein
MVARAAEAATRVRFWTTGAKERRALETVREAAAIVDGVDVLDLGMGVGRKGESSRGSTSKKNLCPRIPVPKTFRIR